jgi:hypothetical protein
VSMVQIAGAANFIQTSDPQIIMCCWLAYQPVQGTEP